MGEAFDYVIVGGGTAGCVLANRLTSSGRHTVALVEAGGARHSPFVTIPAGYLKLLSRPPHNWLMKTEPEPATGGRAIPVPKGKGLGGSTLINGQIWVRGQREDYDGWAQAGCRGWSFEDVLPYFQRVEAFDGAAGETRGTAGALPVTTVPERPAIGAALIEAARTAGEPINADYNDGPQNGFGWYQVNNRGGRRVSAYHAYLKPARRRANLAIMTDALATRVVLEGRRATGVAILQGGTETVLTARREVILAAGAVQSPQLLELSGIGDPAVLQPLGLAVRVALPGVGANAMDHYCTRMNWRVSQRVTLNEATRGLRLAKAAAEYVLFKRGILTIATGLVHGFLRTRPGLVGPDVQLFFMHASYSDAAVRALDPEPGMTVGVTQLRPQSRGTIHIRSADPRDVPAIRPNFLAAEEDRRALVEGMKRTRAIIGAAPMDPYRGPELNPGPDCESDADWLAFARTNGQTIYHVCGTCRMGTDDGAVVDPELTVRGVEGLRVADASVMPTIVSGNTQAAVYMIAEKAAALIAGKP